MKNNVSYDFSLEEFKNKAIENGDGIYVIYNDFLSRDAWSVIAVVDGSIVMEGHPDCWITFNYYRDRTECGARAYIMKLKGKFPDLTIYVANLGYHTFMRKWTYEDVAKEDRYERGLGSFCVFDVATDAEVNEQA